MENIIERLHREGYSCVVANNDEVRTFSRRGVADLYGLLMTDAGFLRGASIADKVVGKAAATLMILGGVSKLYTDIISAPALTLLRDAGLGVEFLQMVPFIKNRDGSGWCPLEMECLRLDEVENIYPVIERFMDSLPQCPSNRLP